MPTIKSRKKTKVKKSKPARNTKIMKRMAAKKVVRKTALKRAVLAKKKVAANRAARKRPAKNATWKIRGKAEQAALVAYENTGPGATGGQSGDTQGLSGIADAESESVKELLEEGQSFEAEVVQGVENVPDADEGQVRTHQSPEDDVPDEYIGKDGQN